MSKVVEIVVQAVDKASKTFDEVSKQSKKLESALKSVKKYSGIAMTALAGVTTYAVTQAVKLEPLKRSFDQLAESVGENSKDMLKALKEASKGAISEYDLMASANKAMKLGVADNTEDMTQLMKIARLYGQQMSQDVTSSFNDIVTGLGRGSAQILDNIGIVVDSEKAYEEYAKKLGKTTSELSKQEKTQALVNATIEEGQKALEKFGEPAQTMGERIQALKNQFQEMATRIGEALVPVLENVMKKLEPIIQKVSDWIAENPELASKILLIGTAITGIVFALSSVMPVLGPIISALGGPGVGLIGAIGLVRGGLQLLEDHIVSTDEQLQIYYDQVVDLNDAYAAGLISEDEYRAKMKELEDQIQATKDKSMTFGQYMKDGLNEVLNDILHPVKSFKQIMADRKAVLPEVQEKFEALTEKIKSFIDKVKSAIDSIKEFARESRENGLASGIVSAGISVAKSIIKGKAVGGSVSANTPYIVGERGPELFVPNNSGNIVPNDQLGSVSININMGGVAINNGTDETQFADMIGETIMRQLELYKKGIY